MKLFCFGLGYVAEHLIDTLNETAELEALWATKRSSSIINIPNVQSFVFEELEFLPSDVTHVLISIPPFGNTDIVLEKFGQQLLKLPKLKWVGLLSATSVYGDQHGQYVDETISYAVNATFAMPRIIAEKKWLNMQQNHKLPLHIFRLSGIYGPKRSELEKALAKQSRIIRKPNHVFSRIHVGDIAQALRASMRNPMPGEIFNVSDDLPSSHEDVVLYTHQLLGLEPPLPEDYDTAEMSEMLRYFYSKSSRIRNDKMKSMLCVKLLYPDYKTGIQAIYSAMEYYHPKP